MSDSNESAVPAEPARGRRRWPFVLPVVAFVAIAAFLGVGLLLNPREIPSALIGQPVPEFTLPALYDGAPPLSNTDFLGEVVLLNFFASGAYPAVSSSDSSLSRPPREWADAGVKAPAPSTIDAAAASSILMLPLGIGEL